MNQTLPMNLELPEPAKKAVKSKKSSIKTLDNIEVGIDVLELLSTAMYVDPLTIYREYVQNSADAIDEARSQKILSPKEPGIIEIDADPVKRSVIIRDNGVAISENNLNQLCNIGGSSKRGTDARGFRGVGRLSGLGFCQELIFRTRSGDDSKIFEITWDCRALKTAFRTTENERDLFDLIRDVVVINKLESDTYPNRFFEVELKGVIRHRNDKLLCSDTIDMYLSQVAPVPFSPEFEFGKAITDFLKFYVNLGEIKILVNSSELQIYRPHRNDFDISDSLNDSFSEPKFYEFTNIDGELGAVAWILHHNYYGAIPDKNLLKGLRVRSGNIQVGECDLFQELFPEARFNSWAVGEVHVLDRRIIPNGRRDNFEQNVHFDNLFNQVAPLAREIGKFCRTSSIIRKHQRDFEFNMKSAIENVEIVKRGGLSKSTKKAHTEIAQNCLDSMKKISEKDIFEPDVRKELKSQLRNTADKVNAVVEFELTDVDPLKNIPAKIRPVYQKMIELIYKHSNNNNSASVLVEKILNEIGSAEKN